MNATEQYQKAWIPMLSLNGFAIICMIIGITTPVFSAISIFCAWTVWIVQIGSYIFISIIGFRGKLSRINYGLLIGWLFISILLQLGIYMQKYQLSAKYENSWGEIAPSLIKWRIFQIIVLILPIIITFCWKKNESMEIKESHSTLLQYIRLTAFFIAQFTGVLLFLSGILFTVLLWIYVNGDFWGYLGIMGLNFPTEMPIIILLGILLTFSLIQEKNNFNKKKRNYLIPKLKKIYIPISILIILLMLIPILFIPFNLKSAKETFPNRWNTEDPTFLEKPYSFSSQIFGRTVPECKVQEDILFFNGSQSSFPQDHNLLLHFDVYSPLKSSENLPGHNATIIRIHGGYWVQGDTKMMVQQCRYFAAQGYIVFDIQYGLHNSTSNTPTNIKGNFTHDDMVRQVGNFTHYLETHADEYGADLNRTVVFGASAGTTLAMAIVYGQSDSRFSEWISQKINFVGLYLFYPASGYQKNRDVIGTPDLLTPEVLIKANSPPCLIFTGTRDQLINPDVSQEIKLKYDNAGNEECVVIWLKFYSHAFAWNEYNSGSQIALYYTERFLKAIT
ncbi:MAG: alpha/beta hydrolase [Candidatus Lokiarchaeota archaeon]|nr:alpha/beta hydrolase [Candidatus Harpocratesius repetitus]